MRTRSSRLKANRHTGPRGQGGFTYLGLLALVAVMGMLLAAAGEVWHTSQQREKERELLFVGHQFRRAIAQYYERAPNPSQRYPQSLEALLKDPRFPATQRYLRRIYADPVGGSTEWGLVKGPGGEIYGVHSLSEEEPVKKSNFSVADKSFEGKTKYSEWVFVHIPKQSPAR
jgi:type II secretory pathway pseudopilin PulG